MQSDIIKPLFK